MSFTSSLPLHGQSGFSTTHRRDRSRFWGYPSDYVFYRTHPSIIPHWPPDLYDDILGTVRGANDDIVLKKKANPCRKISISKKGALQRFTEMPIDILYEVSALYPSILGEAMSGSWTAEFLPMSCTAFNSVPATYSPILTIIPQIFGYLHPMDVLNLSRTTKPLRSILLGRHAGGVWRSALGSVRALPSCPSDMTEPEYASLAFDDWCQVSLSSVHSGIGVLLALRCPETPAPSRAQEYF